jgi:hypothetical protein
MECSSRISTVLFSSITRNIIEYFSIIVLIIPNLFEIKDFVVVVIVIVLVVIS